jgi:hypothetical protein
MRSLWLASALQSRLLLVIDASRKSDDSMSPHPHIRHV